MSFTLVLEDGTFQSFDKQDLSGCLFIPSCIFWNTRILTNLAVGGTPNRWKQRKHLLQGTPEPFQNRAENQNFKSFGAKILRRTWSAKDFGFCKHEVATCNCKWADTPTPTLNSNGLGAIPNILLLSCGSICVSNLFNIEISHVTNNIKTMILALYFIYHEAWS